MRNLPLTVFLAFLLLNATVFAQRKEYTNDRKEYKVVADEPTTEIENWYLEERFIVADQNDDSLLSKDELKKFDVEFSYYLVDQNFTLTDLNKDAQLSYNEISKRVKSEFAYRHAMDVKNLRQYQADYPFLASTISAGDVKYVKKNPELAAKLFGNFYWMSQNALLAKQIYNDHIWAASNPSAIVALHKNLRFMVAYPAQARELYRYTVATDRLPEMLGWRNDHKDLIRKYSNFERFSNLMFMNGGIRIAN